MQAFPRTKIIATLGPSTDRPEILRALLVAGVDVVRLNFSHGPREIQLQRIATARQIARDLGKSLAILADLQGPKIRIASFREGHVLLQVGATFSLDPAIDPLSGDEHGVGILYHNLASDVRPGDRLLLDDGRLVLEVLRVAGDAVVTRVLVGGVLKNQKGLNRLGGGLSAATFTDRDLEDLQAAVEHQVDFLAISFVRSHEDIVRARLLAKQAGGSHVGIVAKIERAEAIERLDAIIDASDAVMVARGDLGVEVGDAELPALQKDIIARARHRNRLVITATQMMESMITELLPTRAEVMDVANAVLDGTDAVMLSAETATGQHPVEVVQAMQRIILGVEKHPRTQLSRHRIDTQFHRIDEAIAMSTMYVANHLGIRAILTLTESGATAIWMSRIRTKIPIFALSRHERTRQKLALCKNVYPIDFDIMGCPRDRVNAAAVEAVQAKGFIQAGDRVILTKGDHDGVMGGTNAMKILSVGDVV